MNYYSHHIGDFDRATRHLTRIERSVYLDLIFTYYDTEQPLISDMATLCRKIVARSEEEKAAVLAVLDEFFTATPAGWYHDRCEDELDSYRKSNTQKSVAGKASAAARSLRREQAINGGSTTVPTTVERACNGTPTNQEPRTNNQEPVKSIEADASAILDEKLSEDGRLVEQVESQLKCPVGHIVDSYHAAMPMNPQVKVLNDARKKTIAARWREASRMTVAPFGYKTVAEGLEAWKAFFEVCNESPFLTGKAKALPGKPPFIADIDFLMSPSGFASTLENKYHREVA